MNRNEKRGERKERKTNKDKEQEKEEGERWKIRGRRNRGRRKGVRNMTWGEKGRE